MKIWDIIDSIYPGVEVTQATAKPLKIARSGAKCSFCLAVGLVVASSGLNISVPLHSVPMADSNNMFTASTQKRPPRSQVADFAVDLQHAMSAGKLSAAFRGYFEPAEDEVEYDGEYFFR